MRDLDFEIRGRDRTQAAFDSARRNARQFHGEIDRTRIVMNAAGAAARAFAGAFALTSISGFAATMRSVVTEASEMAKTADKVGVATGELQRLLFGFGQAGVEAGSVETALEQWGKRIGEAHTQGGRLSEILRANGVVMTDSNGKLRSSVDLMRDYAELIRNAGSDQERLALATEAFGRGGADMVLALRNGAAGMDELMNRADEAGGVIDEELLRRAEALDDEFGKLWRSFEINAKSAILSAAIALQDGLVGPIQGIAAALGEIGNSDVLRRLSAAAGTGNAQLVPGVGVVDPTADVRAAERRTRILADQVANQRDLGNDAIEVRRDLARAQADIDQEVARIMAGAGRGPIGPTRAPTAEPPAEVATTRTTIIPGRPDRPERATGGSRGGSSAGRKEEISAYDQVIERLRQEAELVGLSSVQQRVLTEQRRAGVSATSDQGKAIEGLVLQMDAQREATERLAEQQRALEDATSFMAAGALDAMLDWASGAATAEQALKRLGSEILRAVAYGALLGQGPFGRLFGGGLLSLFMPGIRLADGGPARMEGGRQVGAGMMRGPGGPRGDRIPAWLSDGEYVVNARATEAYRPAIEAMNRMAPSDEVQAILARATPASRDRRDDEASRPIRLARSPGDSAKRASPGRDAVDWMALSDPLDASRPIRLARSPGDSAKRASPGRDAVDWMAMSDPLDASRPIRLARSSGDSAKRASPGRDAVDWMAMSDPLDASRPIRLDGAAGGRSAGRRDAAGMMRGPGGPRGDRIPAWLSDGEFVLNARAVAAYGPAVDAMNRMAPLNEVKGLLSAAGPALRLADGGPAGRPAGRGSGASASAVAGDGGLLPSVLGGQAAPSRVELAPLALRLAIGWSRSADGNLKPMIEEVSEEVASRTVAGGLARYDAALPGRFDALVERLG